MQENLGVSQERPFCTKIIVFRITVSQRTSFDPKYIKIFDLNNRFDTHEADTH